MTTHVYIIASSQDGPVKIGYSKNPEKRLRQLQTGHAEELKVFHSISFDRNRAKLIEKMMHKTLKFQKMTGEWFSLTVAEAATELDFARIRYEDDPVLHDWL